MGSGKAFAQWVLSVLYIRWMFPINLLFQRHQSRHQSWERERSQGTVRRARLLRLGSPWQSDTDYPFKKESELPFLPPREGIADPGGRHLLADSQGSALSPRRVYKDSQLKEYHKECLILRVLISYPSTLLDLQKKHVYQVGYTWKISSKNKGT